MPRAENYAQTHLSYRYYLPDKDRFQATDFDFLQKPNEIISCTQQMMMKLQRYD